MKGVSPFVSMVFVLAFSVVGLTLVVTVLMPVVNRAKDMSVVDEATRNLELLNSVIKEVASESEGAKRTITLTVSDGVYKINKQKDLIYFEYDSNERLELKGTIGNVYVQTAPVFFDFFNNYVENSNASDVWNIKNGTWKVIGNRYYGSDSAFAYKLLGKLKDFSVSGKIINSDDSKPGEVFLTVAPENLVLYLAFDEGSGNFTYDYSGFNNTGTLKDANTTNADGDTPPQWVDGKVDEALSFDGVDDYVEVPDSASLSVTGSLTLSAWAKFNQITTNTQIVAKESGTERGYYLAVLDTGQVRILISPTADGTDYAYFTTTDTLTPNKWYYLVGVFEAGNSLKIYVNGVEKAGSLTGTVPSSIYDNTAKLRISSSERFPTQIINGTIDEVRIYNRALTEDEIKAEYYFSLKKIINKYGVESVSLPKEVNVSLVLSSPYQAYFDDIAVTQSKKQVTLILPFDNIDLTGTFRITKGTHQVVIENEGTNSTTNKPIIKITSE